MKKLRKLFIPLLALTLSACTAPTGLSSAKADAVREYPTLALPGGSVAISSARALVSRSSAVAPSTANASPLIW